MRMVLSAAQACFRTFGNSVRCGVLLRLSTRSRPHTLKLQTHIRSATNNSTGSRSTSANLNQLLQSRVSFTLATGLWIGVCGSLLLYVFKRRRSSKAKLKNSQTGTVGEPGSKDERGRVHTTNRFFDKVVVITGAAGDIGGATATAFAREGATLVLVDLPQLDSILKERSKLLQDEGASSVLHVTADVTKSEDVQKMVQYTMQKVGKIDCFFNNAGIQGALRPLYEQNDKEFQKVTNVNIYGVFLAMKYVSKAMMEAGQKGVIVNTASLAGLVGPANMAAYAASKFAVVGMTKTAAKDLAPHGIRVCAIAPGLLEGKMWGTQIRGNAESRKRWLLGDESHVTEDELHQQEQRMINDTPMRRLGKLSEVASVVLFLCSDEASYLTGVTLPIDGGKLR